MQCTCNFSACHEFGAERPYLDRSPRISGRYYRKIGAQVAPAGQNITTSISTTQERGTTLNNGPRRPNGDSLQTLRRVFYIGKPCFYRLG